MGVFSRLESIGNNVRDYAETRISLMKLDAAEKGSKAASHLTAFLVVGLICSIAFIFLSITAAILIAKWTGELYLGFLLVSIFYILLALFVWRFRSKLIQVPILNAMLRQLF